MTEPGLEAGLLPLSLPHSPGEGEEPGLLNFIPHLPAPSPRPPPAAFPDLESIYLQDSLLSVPSQDDSLLAFSSPDGWPSPGEPPTIASGPQPPSPEQQHRQRLLGAPGPERGARLQGSLPSVDSGSLSEEEDEVFYN